MRTIIAMLAFLMLGQAQAQNVQANSEPEAVVVQQAPVTAPVTKTTVIYDEKTNQLVEAKPQVVETAAPQPAASPIYILNNQNQRVQGSQTQKAAQVQENPTTVIQEAPLKISAAEEMRKKRQSTEAGTEDSIVQTLEKARLEDEMRRREKFTGALVNTENTQIQQQTTTVIAAPVAAPIAAPVVAPVAVKTKEVVVIEEVEEVQATRPAKKESARAEIKASIEDVDHPALILVPKNYISGLLGLGRYSDTVNMNSEATGGFAVGTMVSRNLVLEGAFSYSNYAIGGFLYGYMGVVPTTMDVSMKQYNYSGALKYEWNGWGMLRPNVGALLSYVRRNYSLDGYSNSYLGSSDALDVGFMGGLDVQIYRNFAIGGEARYMTNVWKKQNSGWSTAASNVKQVYYPRLESPENIDYWVTSVLVKYQF